MIFDRETLFDLGVGAIIGSLSFVALYVASSWTV